MESLAYFNTRRHADEQQALVDAITCMTQRLRETRTNVLAWFILESFNNNELVKSLRIEAKVFEEPSLSGMGTSRVVVLSVECWPTSVKLNVPDNLVPPEVFGAGVYEANRDDPLIAQQLESFASGNEELAVFHVSRLLDVEFDEHIEDARVVLSTA